MSDEIAKKYKDEIPEEEYNSKTGEIDDFLEKKKIKEIDDFLKKNKKKQNKKD